MKANPDSPDYRQGVIDAQADLGAGRPRMHSGASGRWGEYLADLLWTSFGVQVESTSCFVWQSLIDYRGGYDATITQWIAEEYGPDALDRVWQLAQNFRHTYYIEFFKTRVPMEISVDSRRKSQASLEKAHPRAKFIDVTSKGAEPWVQFSPFFPHGGLPVPFSDGVEAESVEGIWQGLKVFEKEDIDPRKFAIRNMSGIKRSTRKHGKVLGHRRGVEGRELLSYLDARKQIYLPSYRYVLQHKLETCVRQIEGLAIHGPVVLLDYETNTDIEDLSKPLSHASLIADWIASRCSSDNPASS